MQEEQSHDFQVGELVRIEWPRTRWDRRVGKLVEVRREPGAKEYGFVLIDGIAVLLAAERMASRQDDISKHTLHF